MNLSEIKLVASDMDGTLLNSKGELNKDFFSLFEKMKTKGILFTVASGRQLFSLQKQFENIQNEMVFIAENGSYILFKGEELLIQSLYKNTVLELIEKIRKIPNTHIILCGKKTAYIDSYDTDFTNSLKHHYRKYVHLDDLMEVPDDDFLKITVYDVTGAEQNSYPHFKELEGDFQVKVSGAVWLDISHKLANKGNAIKIVQKKIGISSDQTMVFGDYLNDLEMMEEAYFSYAMENAHPEVKKTARFITKSNDDNGVLSVLNSMLSAQKTVKTI